MGGARSQAEVWCRFGPGWLVALAGVAGPGVGCGPGDLPRPDPAVHRAEVAAWHAGRIDELRQPDGWLSLVGLFWLDEGESSFGSDSANAVVFPASAPARIGTFLRTGTGVRMTVAAGVDVSYGGTPVRVAELTPQPSIDPTAATLGSFSWYVIERQGMTGIRLRDAANPAIAAFAGIETFPIDHAWNVPARFDRYDPPRILEVPTVLGTVAREPSPGAVVFRVHGTRYRLDVTGDPDAAEYFIVFGDRTNGEETYGGGRFLEVGAPDSQGRTFIDFNRAYNPPCVFTVYATCPLPTRQNRLAVRIEAGEKMWGDRRH